MNEDKLILGTWNVICQRCNRKRKAFEVIKDCRLHIIVCRDTCYDECNPQEIVHPTPVQPPLPWIRPEHPDNFIAVSYADVGADFCFGMPFGRFSQADYGVADCMEVDYLDNGLIP